MGDEGCVSWVGGGWGVFQKVPTIRDCLSSWISDKNNCSHRRAIEWELVRDPPKRHLEQVDCVHT